MWVAFLSVVLGLGVALTPGQSVALACANTERAGWRGGATTVVGSTTADVAIAAVAVTILFGVGDRLASFVGVVGGVMVLGLGLDALMVSRDRHPMPRTAATPNRLLRGFWSELTLPQALLFGLTAVGPSIVHLRESEDGFPWAMVAVIATALMVGRLAMVTWVSRSGEIPRRGRYRVVCWVAGVALSAAGLAMMGWLGAYALGL